DSLTRGYLEHRMILLSPRDQIELRLHGNLLSGLWVTTKDLRQTESEQRPKQKSTGRNIRRK
ncbi:MAG: hypothetical protein JXK93_09275, partial [Sphaerochaetaceae bacterium]|nr:hypothetical protein [Sphaerochaetaceae bacterium]